MSLVLGTQGIALYEYLYIYTQKRKHSLIYSMNKYFLSICYTAPVSVRVTAENKRDKVSALTEFVF